MTARQLRQRDRVAQRYGRRPSGTFEDADNVYGNRFRSAYGDAYSPYRSVRRADPFADERADRIAAARSDGYSGWRPRNNGYPIGMRHPGFFPYFADDPSGLE